MSFGSKLKKAALKVAKNPLINPVAGATQMAKSAGKIAKKAKGGLKKVMPGVANALTSVAGAAGPLMQFIPGASQISQLAAHLPQMMSFMNDDSWFGGETGAGAAFNELVAARNYGTGNKQLLEVQAGIIEVATFPSNADALKDELMPTILAFVRKKTNNVLVDSPDKYFEAFVATEHLFAVYYTLRKFEYLAQHLPPNLPTLPDFARILSPEVVNQFIGIADALESYLRASTGLPYALAAYIRWRFGTTFHSDNTGKPGLIVYDIPLIDTSETPTSVAGLEGSYMNDGQFVGIAPNQLINNITHTVSVLKSIISASGRAAADFATAYMDAGIKFDVDLPHYDEKEYNLRANMKHYDAYYAYTGSHQLIKDSRLDMNAAIQAVTLSTPEDSQSIGDTTPFPIWDYTVGINLQNGKWLNDAIEVGGTPINNATIDGSFYKNLNWRWISMGNISYIQLNGDNIQKFVAEIVSAMLTSLQLHNFDNFVDTEKSGSNSVIVTAQPLSYDTALISQSAIKAIHRLAIRNLTRGDFTRQHEDEAKKKRLEPAVVSATEKIITPEVVEDAVKSLN
jgi:hypothetical protein